MDDPLTETWAIHQRVNAYFLAALDDEALALAPPKCRSVGKLFAHVHDIRLMWLKAAVPDVLACLEKFGPDATLTVAGLTAALDASGRAVGELLARSVAAGGKVKGFKPHATAFLGYLISHESHHRGQAGWALKLAGRPLDKKFAFGLWEWGTR